MSNGSSVARFLKVARLWILIQAWLVVCQESCDSTVEAVVCRVAGQSWAGQKNGVKKPNQDVFCFLRSPDTRYSFPFIVKGLLVTRSI